MSARTQKIYEFGRFRLLAADRFLLCDGQALPLTPKALEILLLLVENHGHVVEKNALMERVWPDTHVQEDNITYNISMLRKALGDGANGERYIETVPRRGYRFVAPVRIVDDDIEAGIPDPFSPLAGSPSPIDAPSESHPGTPLKHPAGSAASQNPSLVARRNWLLRASVMLAGVIVLASTGFVVFVRQQGAHRLKARDSVVLAEFSNSTGDPVFDDTLRQALAVALQQSPFLNILPDQKVRETLRMMGHPSGERLTAEVTQELCQRTGSKAMLDGSISKLGSEYVINLNAVDCQAGNSLVREQVQAPTKEKVLDALGGAATKLRGKLGESFSTVQKLDIPLEQATTPSLEALQAYSRGTVTLDEGNTEGAVPFFEHAISLDPNFAMAYAKLGASYANLGESDLAAKNARKAYELRERVTEREKYYIELHYHDLVTGDLEKARQACELWAKTYPRDGEAHNELGAIYTNLGQYDNGLGELQESLRLDPGSGESYANLVINYIYLNRLVEARATINEAQAKNLDSVYLHEFAYVLAFVQNDTAEMAKQVVWAAGKPGVEDVMFAFEADTAAYSGRLEMARQFSDRAATSAKRAKLNEAAAGYEAAAAIREALFGNATEARSRAAAALKLSNNRYVQFGAALALAFVGDTAPRGSWWKIWPAGSRKTLLYNPASFPRCEVSWR